MVSYPKCGDRVVIRYKKSLKDWFPLEGREGIVEIPCRPRFSRQPVGVAIDGCTKRVGPRNHGVRVDGVLYVIPCGNLQRLTRKVG